MMLSRWPLIYKYDVRFIVLLCRVSRGCSTANMANIWSSKTQINMLPKLLLFSVIFSRAKTETDFFMFKHIIFISILLICFSQFCAPAALCIFSWVEDLSLGCLVKQVHTEDPSRDNWKDNIWGEQGWHWASLRFEIKMKFNKITSQITIKST